METGQDPVPVADDAPEIRRLSLIDPEKESPRESGEDDGKGIWRMPEHAQVNLILPELM